MTMEEEYKKLIEEKQQEIDRLYEANNILKSMYIPIDSKIEDVKKVSKFIEMQNTYQIESSYFNYDSYIFELSPMSITLLQKTLLDFQNNSPDSGYYTIWDKKAGTYTIGDNKIILNHSNVMSFAEAMQSKFMSCYAWQDLKQKEISQATTIEEIEAISTEYPS